MNYSQTIIRIGWFPTQWKSKSDWVNEWVQMDIFLLLPLLLWRWSFNKKYEKPSTSQRIGLSWYIWDIQLIGLDLTFMACKDYRITNTEETWSSQKRKKARIYKVHCAYIHSDTMLIEDNKNFFSNNSTSQQQTRKKIHYGLLGDFNLI